MNMHVNDADLGTASLLVRVENDFDFRSTEYLELFRRSGATAFQLPFWLHAIYTVLAPGQGARPHILAVRRARTGELLMIVPLVMQKSLQIRLLQPADLGVCDYNCIIAEPEVAAALPGNEEFRRQMRGLLDAGDVLIFRKLRHSPSEIADIFGPGSESRNDNEGFETELTGDSFEDWQKSRLKKSFRNGANRRLRNLLADHRSVDFTTFTKPEEIEQAIRFIAEHRSARFKDDILRQQPYLDFYLHCALAGAASGEAVTSGLVVDGTLVSADFGIVGGGVYHSILCAKRPDQYGRYAPGLLALLALIRKRHEMGESRFDFGIGKSRQKSDLAGTEIPLYNVTIARTMSGRLVSLIYNKAKPLKTVLRKSLGWIR